MNVAENAEQRLLLFLHIPKTAGGSFLVALKNLFGDSHVLWLDGHSAGLLSTIAAATVQPPAQLACIVGHVPLHIFAPYLTRLRPFTVLRNPVARVLSLCRFYQQASARDLERVGLFPGFDMTERVNDFETAAERI